MGLVTLLARAMHVPCCLGDTSSQQMWRVCRGLQARRMLRARQAATLIASAWRGYVGRRMARQQRHDTAATRIAACWRGHRQRKTFLAHRVILLADSCPLYADSLGALV